MRGQAGARSGVRVARGCKQILPALLRRPLQLRRPLLTARLMCTLWPPLACLASSVLSAVPTTPPSSTNQGALEQPAGGRRNELSDAALVPKVRGPRQRRPPAQAHLGCAEPQTTVRSAPCAPPRRRRRRPGGWRACCSCRHGPLGWYPGTCPWPPGSHQRGRSRALPAAVAPRPAQTMQRLGSARAAEAAGSATGARA